MDIEDLRQVKTLGGRLSFHKLTALEAYEEAKEGPYAASVKTPADGKPYVNLLVTDVQYKKAVAAAEKFLAMCEAQYKIGDKEKHALSPAQADALRKEMADMDGLLNIPFKMPSEKTLDLFPECAAVIKVLGSAGVDLPVEAIVKGEAELVPPDPDVLQFPLVKPINLTTHSLYNGCWVVLKGMQFYRYFNGGPKKPGFSLGFGSKGSVVFSRDDAAFGGGTVVADDDVFMAADE